MSTQVKTKLFSAVSVHPSRNGQVTVNAHLALDSVPQIDVIRNGDGHASFIALSFDAESLDAVIAELKDAMRFDMPEAAQ